MILLQNRIGLNTQHQVLHVDITKDYNIINIVFLPIVRNACFKLAVQNNIDIKVAINRHMNTHILYITGTTILLDLGYANVDRY